VRIRLATSTDSLEVLRWRNELGSRMNSRENDLIPLETHEKWFEQVLNNPERVLLIGESDDAQSLGQVRFDRVGIEAFSYEVSITLAPEARGQGLALPLLSAAEVFLLEKRGTLQLRAFVNNGNKASEHLFLRGGYSPGSLTEASGHWLVKEIHV
jgi:RimJ/RimL family protein N-acetyltransferase